MGVTGSALYLPKTFEALKEEEERRRRMRSDRSQSLSSGAVVDVRHFVDVYHKISYVEQPHKKQSTATAAVRHKQSTATTANRKQSPALSQQELTNHVDSTTMTHSQQQQQVVVTTAKHQQSKSRSAQCSANNSPNGTPKGSMTPNQQRRHPHPPNGLIIHMATVGTINSSTLAHPNDVITQSSTPTEGLPVPVKRKISEPAKRLHPAMLDKESAVQLGSIPAININHAKSNSYSEAM